MNNDASVCRGLCVCKARLVAVLGLNSRGVTRTSIRRVDIGYVVLEDSL
jgi:hypothetical protein